MSLSVADIGDRMRGTPTKVVWSCEESLESGLSRGFRDEGRRGRGYGTADLGAGYRADMIACEIDETLTKDGWAWKVECHRQDKGLT